LVPREGIFFGFSQPAASGRVAWHHSATGPAVAHRRRHEDNRHRQNEHKGSEIAQDAPVVITKDGHPRNVLISIEEYERLKTRDQQAFLAADTPDEFLMEIEALASGEGR